MRPLVLVFLCLLSLCAASSLPWRSSDRLLFPEQLEYLQLHAKYCRDENLILWGDRQCYRENEMGPCNANAVLVFDTKLLRPYCRTL